MLEEALVNLGRVTIALQLETEALNVGIAAFDAQLAKIAPGVLVWLTCELPGQKDWILGYARVGVEGRMAVAVRQGETEPIPLINAPRHVRAAAVARFEDLVAVLTDRVCEHTAEIRAACSQLPRG